MKPFQLLTGRLLIRPLTLDDFEDVYEIWGDAETMQFYPQPLQRHEISGWFEKVFQRYEKDGVSLWAVARRDDNAFVGECGLLMQPVEGVLETEVSYHFKRSAWGHGYATEAARACMDYAFNELGRQRLISLIRPENLPSRRVAERNGLAIEKTIDWHGLKHFVYATAK